MRRLKTRRGLYYRLLLQFMRIDPSASFSSPPPASVLLKKAAGLAKGSSVPNRDKVGKVSKDQVLEIAKTKKEDLNANSDEAACRIIEGTARSMGIEISRKL